LRTGIGIIGVGLPIVLIIGNMILSRNFVFLDSMSAYYQGVMRDVFVGCLWAIGIFLICYQYDYLDNIASNVAGVAVILVSLFPDFPVHQVSAGCFFFIIALMAIFLFQRTDSQQDPTPEKLQRNRVYLTCGIVIVLSLLLIGVAYQFEASNPWLQSLHPILVFEVIASLAFGIAWFVKGGTLVLKDKS
jgi:hypothetical protein